MQFQIIQQKESFVHRAGKFVLGLKMETNLKRNSAIIGALSKRLSSMVLTITLLYNAKGNL